MVALPCILENEYGPSGPKSEGPYGRSSTSILQPGRSPHPGSASSRSRAQGCSAQIDHSMGRAQCLLLALLFCGLSGLISPHHVLAWHYGKIEFEPYVGGLFLGERPYLEDAPVMGGRLVAATGRRSAIEISAAMAPTNSISDPGFVVNVFLLQLDVCYNIGAVPDGTSVRAFPFLVLGIGAIDYDPGGSVDDAEDAADFAINFGIGGEYHFDELLSLRVDVRDFLAALTIERFPLDLLSELRLQSPKWTHNIEISAGIGVSF